MVRHPHGCQCLSLLLYFCAVFVLGQSGICDSIWPLPAPKSEQGSSHAKMLSLREFSVGKKVRFIGACSGYNVTCTSGAPYLFELCRKSVVACCQLHIHMVHESTSRLDMGNSFPILSTISFDLLHIDSFRMTSFTCPESA